MSVTLVKHYNPTWPSWFEELRQWQLAEEHDNDRQSYMDGKVALCEETYPTTPH